ncbi:MAG: HIT family protein [Burkholderiales bacterium]|nr:HIT family protein [Burkholderiales bacterium]
MQDCILCTTLGGTLVYKNSLFRVILPHEVDYPGSVRLIANFHVKELTDLSDIEANHIFSALLKIERLIRKLYIPDKVNLASLGNIVPHLHWHIIPRYLTDKHFPNPIWGDVTHANYIPPSKLYDLQEALITELHKILGAD